MAGGPTEGHVAKSSQAVLVDLEVLGIVSQLSLGVWTLWTCYGCFLHGLFFFLSQRGSCTTIHLDVFFAFTDSRMGARMSVANSIL